jgi:hypothetical protein
MRVLSGLALDHATHKKSQPARGRIPTRAQERPMRNRSVGRGAAGVQACFSGKRHQNQPPDGTRPLRRRYVTRLP